MLPQPKLYPYKLDANLTLKALEPEDAKEFYDFLQAHKQHLSRFDQFAQTFHTLDSTRQDLATIQELYAKGERLSCGIWEGRKLIGYITGIFDPSKNTIRIGYGLAEDHQGRGIIARSVQAVLNYAFEHLQADYAWLTIWTSNLASIKVAERLRFKRQPGIIPANPIEKTPAQYKYVLKNPR